MANMANHNVCFEYRKKDNARKYSSIFLSLLSEKTIILILFMIKI